jgi:hypothetical protein
VFALLVGIGIGTAALLWTSEQRRAALNVHERDITARVEGLTATSRDVAAYQAAYVALAQPLQPSLDRVAANLQTLAANVSALATTVRSADATSSAAQVADDVKRLADADRTIRENLKAGETLMATDLIFGEARHTIDGIVVSLRELRDVELSATATERQLVDRQASTALAGSAGLWLLGLICLVPIPVVSRRSTAGAEASVAQTDAAAASAPSPAVDASELRLVPESVIAAPRTATATADAATGGDAHAVPAASAQSTSPVDLAAAADVCTAISRVTSASALTDVLGRAAAVLDASGMIVWMGAGEELFPATAYGYDPRIVSRLGPIARFADNATANAWLMGQVRTVAGDATTHGAIVAPMFGPDACIGVLAAEVRHGRESDPATQAVTMMIAAQLATAVVAWPAASSAETKAG